MSERLADLCWLRTSRQKLINSIHISNQMVKARGPMHKLVHLREIPRHRGVRAVSSRDFDQTTHDRSACHRFPERTSRPIGLTNHRARKCPCDYESIFGTIYI